MTNTWVNAHGRLWYDDPWYRAAWIAWPQFIGLMVFLPLWAHHSAPWGKPAEQAEVSAGCSTGNDYNSRVSACSAQITSGKLKGDQLARGYHMRGWAYYMLKQPQAAMRTTTRLFRYLRPMLTSCLIAASFWPNRMTTRAPCGTITKPSRSSLIMRSPTPIKAIYIEE